MGTVCCPEACGVCGGSGCGNIPGTTTDDCCASTIADSGVYCVDGVKAPCILGNDTNTAAPTVTALPFSSPIPIDSGSEYLGDIVSLYFETLNIFLNYCLNMLQALEFLGNSCRHSAKLPAHSTPPNCSNDLNGVENATDTSPEACGVCGGSDCGSIPRTTSDHCCVSTIADSGVYCFDGVKALYPRERHEHCCTDSDCFALQLPHSDRWSTEYLEERPFIYTVRL